MRWLERIFLKGNRFKSICSCFMFTFICKTVLISFIYVTSESKVLTEVFFLISTWNNQFHDVKDLKHLHLVLTIIKSLCQTFSSEIWSFCIEMFLSFKCYHLNVGVFFLMTLIPIHLITSVCHCECNNHQMRFRFAKKIYFLFWLILIEISYLNFSSHFDEFFSNSVLIISIIS